MSAENPSNPIGQDYADTISEFLEGQVGWMVSPDLIEQLRDLVTTHVCELTGIFETSEILGVSRQYVSEMAKEPGKMPPQAAKVRATPLWVKKDIEELDKQRRLRSTRNSS